jgi:hypothetical protein
MTIAKTILGINKKIISGLLSSRKIGKVDGSKRENSDTFLTKEGV